MVSTIRSINMLASSIVGERETQTVTSAAPEYCAIRPSNNGKGFRCSFKISCIAASPLSDETSCKPANCSGKVGNWGASPAAGGTGAEGVASGKSEGASKKARAVKNNTKMISISFFNISNLQLWLNSFVFVTPQTIADCDVLTISGEYFFKHKKDNRGCFSLW